MNNGYDIFEERGISVIRAWGDTDRELFGHALAGLAAFLRPDAAYRPKTMNVRAHVHGGTLSETLKNFLNLAVFESDMHGAVFPALDIIAFSNHEIECEMSGLAVEHFEEEVKEVVLPRSIYCDSRRYEVEFIPALL